MHLVALHDLVHKVLDGAGEVLHALAGRQLDLRFGRAAPYCPHCISLGIAWRYLPTFRHCAPQEPPMQVRQPLQPIAQFILEPVACLRQFLLLPVLSKDCQLWDA